MVGCLSRRVNVNGTPEIGYGHGALRLLTEWADTITAGEGGECLVPAVAALHVAQLLEAIYLSSREGRRVAVNIG